MNNNLLGFLISALLHVGGGMLVISLGDSQPTKSLESISIPLTLAMFEPAREPAPESVIPVEPLPDSLPRSKAEPKVAPVIEAKPKPPEPKAKPKLKKKKATKKITKKIIKKKIIKKKLKNRRKQKVKPKPKKDLQFERLASAVMNPPQPVRAKPVARPVSRPAVGRPVRQVKHGSRPAQRPASGRVTPQRARPKVNSVQAGKAEAAYKARLKQLLNANKPYPKRAKRRGKQGRVNVSFTILRNGLIESIRVVRSSGNSSLDNAALRAVKSISGQLPFPKEITKSQWVFTVPVIYQLR